MAKVDGPLLSIEARGKIADAIVFFPWKGRHVVRQWLKPTNPQSTLQGYLRAALKAIAKWITTVDCTSKGGSADCVIYQGATSSVPAGTNWNAWLNQGFLDLLQSAGTFQTSSFAALVAEYSSLGTDVLTAFQTNATLLAIEDFAFNYGYTTNIEAGFQLYAGAKACYQKSIIGSAPYDTDPASWAASDVDDFKEDHTTAA